MPMDTTRRQWLGSAAMATGALSSCATACAATTRHVVLLGDSIFDNGRYVPGQPAVGEQLRAALGPPHAATLLARDGDMVAGVVDQLAGLPATATHLVLSVGGNDALEHQGLLRREVGNAAEVFGELATIRIRFAAEYRELLTLLRARNLPLAVCTIYDSNFDPPAKALADAALTVFNDAITRAAADAGVPIVDLRRIFTSRTDYANPIEPSVSGGAKLARAIVNVVTTHDFGGGRCTFYA
jgi:lysophospholipase L1-like esterase